MSNYLARLKLINAVKIATSPTIELPKLSEVPKLNFSRPFGSFGSSLQESNPITNSENEALSNWWKITYINLQTKEVAIHPPCTKAEVLALNEDIVSIIPISSPVSQIESFESPEGLLKLLKEADFQLNIINGELHVDSPEWLDDQLIFLLNKYRSRIKMLIKDNPSLILNKLSH